MELASWAGSRDPLSRCLRLRLPARASPRLEGVGAESREELEERQNNGSLRAYLFGAPGYFRPTGGRADGAFQGGHRILRRQSRKGGILGGKVPCLSDQKEPQGAFLSLERRGAA